jgi:hypothetical protein
MYDHKLYVRTLSEFTRVLLSPYDVHAALGELADRVSEALGLIGSGVSLIHDGRLEFDNAHGAPIAEVERVQEQVQVGPCVAAVRSGQVVAVTDLASQADRWPDYCDAAARVGITAVASLPMRLGEDDAPIGALNLYADGLRDWPEEDVAAAAVMADMATAYLVNASYHRKQVELAEQLQSALDSRVIIEQAKGVLVARHRIAPGEAFNRLRRYARSRSVSLTSVADAVVRLKLDP